MILSSSSLMLAPREKQTILSTELIKRLTDQEVTGCCSLFDAPPGYGKRFTLSAIYHERLQQNCQCIWLALPNANSSCEQLLRGILEVFSRSDDTAVDSTAASEISLRSMQTALSSSKTPVEIFIPNLECCTDRKLGQTLDQLIALPPVRHLWLSVSRRISFDITRQLTEGSYRYFGTEELSLTPADSKLFLASKSERILTDQQVTNICARTFGWPLATSLLATMLRDSENPEALIAQFSGCDLHLAAFLRSHLLDRLGPAQSSFLMQIAHFQPITRELCRYALQNSGTAKLLDGLLRENSYLRPLDQNCASMELQPLVRQFLICEAERELEPEQIAAILRRAMAFELRRGNISGAVQYALATQCPQVVADMLHQIAPTWVGQKGALNSYIDWVEQARRIGSVLTIESEYWYLWSLLFARQHEAAFKQSELLWERSANDPVLASSPEQNLAFRRRFEELRILVDIFRDQTAEAGQKAVKWLEDSTAQNDISMATVACCVAINATVNFDFKTARDAMHTAQVGCISANSDYGVAWVSVLSAEVDFYEGEYSHCYESLNSALMRAIDYLGTDSSVVATAQLLMASCLLQMGLRARALDMMAPALLHMQSHGISETTFCGIEAAVELWDENEESALAPSRVERLIEAYPPPANFVFSCFLIRRLLRLGRLEEAQLQAELIGLDLRSPARNSSSPPLFVQELRSRTCLEYLLAVGRNRQAAGLAEALAKAAEQNKRRAIVVETDLIQGILCFRLDNLPHAQRHVHRAIRLAAKRAILLPFLQRLDALTPIFNKVKERDWGFADKDERALFEKLRSMAPSKSHLVAEAQPALEDVTTGGLTARELELLRLADAGLSNQQIADRTNVALTTVKWHFSNIFSKLEVRSRSAATAKVRALNLL